MISIFNIGVKLDWHKLSYNVDENKLRIEVTVLIRIFFTHKTAAWQLLFLLNASAKNCTASKSTNL